MTDFRQIAILVEGQTESAFVTEILGPYLQPFGAYVTPVIVKTARLADGTTYKGGGMVWKQYHEELLRLLGSSHYRCVSILVDFYAYPRNAPGSDCCPVRINPAVVPRCGRRRWPDYDKVIDGIEVIREAGLEAVMERCPGLKAWVGALLDR